MELGDRLGEALDFHAPYVIERLMKDRVVDDPAQAGQLFAEAKRYLVLCEASPGAAHGMYSAMVDAAWHTFILFTAEYTDYCNRCFGGYVHHSPAIGSGEHRGTDARRPQPNIASFNEFRQRYEELFGEQLPPVWYDDTSVTPRRRIVNESAGELSLTVGPETVELIDGTGEAVISVDVIAAEGLDFIAREPVFYVREIPGGLTDEEKVGVVQALVRTGVLHVAP